MSFGSCCILHDSDFSDMKAKSVQIKGEQYGLIINFELIQTFYHTEKKPQEVYYLFPNDLKLCIYDTTFVVGKEIIKPTLKPKEEAKKTYDEAVERGHTAVYGSNIENGITEFKLGNVPASTDCKVILKIAFTANITKENSFFVKFPLDLYTPSGSCGCLDVLSSDFLFQLQCDKEKIKDVKSNIKNGQYDNSQKIFFIREKIQCNDNEKSIIINFETINPIQSSVYVGQSANDYDTCSLTIFPNLEEKQSESSKEFIFLIDCSGSMDGLSIKKASECLEVFIRSLPVNSYFNVIRFGSRFDKLFESSTEYNESSIQKALDLAKNLDADLGGTEIYQPLESIFKECNKFGQRQIFIMTDGEVWDVSRVFDLISVNSNNNRCFTIGIGRGCDAGLVEGMAKRSGGKCDFVQEGDSISEKVIPQLQSSLFGVIDSIEIHIEGEENDSFQTSPFPLPIVNSKGGCIIYLRSKRQSKTDNKFNKNFLITANYGDENIEIPITEVSVSQNHEEDEFGCSEGKNIGKAILPLFAFNLLQKYENKDQLSDAEKKNAIELSLSSGVLCKFTGYVGISGVLDRKIIRPLFRDDFIRVCADDLCIIGCCYDCKDDCCEDKCCCRREYEYSYDCEDDCCFESVKDNIDTFKLLHHSRKYSDENDDDCEYHNENDVETQKLTNDDDDIGSFNLMSVMRMQNFNGYWEDLNKLNKMLKLNVSHIDGVDVADGDAEKKCIATLIAIAALHVKSADERNTWIMIEQKAISWLKKVLPNSDIDKLINEAKSLI